MRVHNFAMSLDGYAAGPDQSELHPLGVGGTRLHEWVFTTPRDPVDDELLAWGDDGIGATVMGRNMFGPVRGPWPDGSWQGWWGEDPPFHHPVFVMTHHLRESVPMAGGTVFHFVDAAPRDVLDLAMEAAGGRDVRLGGGDDWEPALVALRLNGGRSPHERQHDQEEHDPAEQHEQGAEHPAVVGAAMHYLMDTARGRNVRVMMPYADALERLAAWFVHVFAPWGERWKTTCATVPSPNRRPGPNSSGVMCRRMRGVNAGNGFPSASAMTSKRPNASRNPSGVSRRT